MNRSSTSFFMRVLLLVLLLWGQSAVAQHAVDHVFHDHVDACQVFELAGIADDVVFASAELPRFDWQGSEFTFCLTPRATFTKTHAAVRAPPSSSF